AGQLHDLRADQTRMREAAADLVKKDDFQSRSTSIWNRIQELNGLTANVTVVSNKLATLEQQLTAADRERKELQSTLANLIPLKDRIGLLDEHRKVSDQDHKDVLAINAALTALRDKDVALEKAIKEAEVERRDACREMQQLRERIAKVEGLQEAKPSKKSVE